MPLADTVLMSTLESGIIIRIAVISGVSGHEVKNKNTKYNLKYSHSGDSDRDRL